MKSTVEQLLRDQRDDLRLRDHLAGICRDPAFAPLTWFWGPELYSRNRVVFRETIVSWFSTSDSSGWRFQRILWKEHSDRLESWLIAARKHRDSWLTRRLLAWKYANERWGVDEERWNAALLQDYTRATTPAAQAVVLEEYDTWFRLDQPTALALYRANRNCSKYVLQHLPQRYTFWGTERREPWRQLIRLATEQGDDDLAFALYRRQIDTNEWQRDIEQLADTVADPDRLNDELRKRHPEGWGVKLGDGVLSLLKRRGRDVFPYVREKLETIFGGWNRMDPNAVLKFAESQGWWDLWTATVRVSTDQRIFNRETKGLLEDVRLDNDTRQERLRALAGVSREWNWPGVGFAMVHALDDELAARLYRRYPELVRGPFKPHVVPRWWRGGELLLAAAEEAADDELIDLLAGRYATQVNYAHSWNPKGSLLVERLAASYQSLRDRDPTQFATRAANVLTQIPAFAIHRYDELLRTNPLARLFFVRSFSEYLAAPTAVRDLIEGSEIHVQMLGYRILAQDDDRARQMAVETLEILIGTLLRPLHRKTRLAAFGALLSAARGDSRAAELVLRRAREALRLPDTKYPKEELIGLMGQVLHFRPELRGPREQVTVYGREEAVA